jgi:hypothetical protein
VNGPQGYDEVAEIPLADVLNRFQALEDRNSMARSIAALRARGGWNADGSIRPEDYPPLTAAEQLELVALGERLARYYRHPVLVHHAVTAGATWAQIAAATGGNPDQVREAYAGWADQQHRLRADFPGGTIGLGDDEYAAAIEAAGEQETDQAAEDTRRLDRIRVVLAKFDWEHDDRQFALEAIERIVEGGQA